MFRFKVVSMFLMLFAVGFFTLAPVTSQPVVAQSMTDEDVYRENTDIQKIFHKLGRGVVNVLTGWIEIPKNIAEEWRRTDPFTGTILGLFKGIGWGVARTFAGFYEIISFPFPVPRNYEPVMYPEFVLPTVWGERLPLYRDEFIGTNATSDAAIDYGSVSQARDAAEARRDSSARTY